MTASLNFFYQGDLAMELIEPLHPKISKSFSYLSIQICKFWLKIGTDYASVIAKAYVSFAFIKNRCSMSYKTMFVGRRWYTQAVQMFK